MMHVEDGHFEPCLKDIGAWGQKLWPKVISFGEVNEHFILLHAVLLLVLIESVQLHHEDELIEF
jgi:hypothetical protein